VTLISEQVSEESCSQLVDDFPQNRDLPRRRDSPWMGFSKSLDN